MKDISKYQGVIPAFYACYDAAGEISPEAVRALTRHLVDKGVKGRMAGRGKTVIIWPPRLPPLGPQVGASLSSACLLYLYYNPRKREKESSV